MSTTRPISTISADGISIDLIKFCFKPDSAWSRPRTHLIPKRHIETWILYLTGQSVDEDTHYHNAPGVDEVIERSSKGFFELIKAMPVAAESIESLVTAIPEPKRLG